MEKIRKGDEVIVITGKDKGRRGKVSMRLDASHVLVEGCNIAKKHVRPNPMKGVVGGILEKEMPIHISNVALFNPATGKADRVRIDVRVVEGGRKKTERVRVFKSNGEPVASA
ncbi:MAG: 50S ribosomal protein L24 [Zoogloeaceae bacterium]|jgi:large subunit ribosomal protein L24|nr:50S ribosomal protein L24 [Zoogloeaceae bacterium]